MNSDSLEPRRLLCPDDGRLLRADPARPQGIAICPECAGIWISGDVVRGRGNLDLPEPSPVGRTRRANATHQCPACEKPLRQQQVGDVTLDVCAKCDGAWIEPGEHDAARRYVRQVRIGSRVPSLKPISSGTLKMVGALVDVLGRVFIDDPDFIQEPLESPDPRSYVPDSPKPSPPEVVTYRPEFRAAFDSLNRRWIEQYFRMEPRDEAVLRDPEGEILSSGGEIFFLLLPDRKPIGTCAMIRTGEGVFYLAKMAVDPAVQGRGYGERLLAAALEWARTRRARRVELTSNTRLAPAIALYRKHGFREVPLEPSDAGYERVNIRMALDLN